MIQPGAGLSCLAKGGEGLSVTSATPAAGSRPVAGPQAPSEKPRDDTSDIKEQDIPSATIRFRATRHRQRQRVCKTADVTLFSKDPVTGAPIPPKGAPSHTSHDAMR